MPGDGDPYVSGDIGGASIGNGEEAMGPYGIDFPAISGAPEIWVAGLCIASLVFLIAIRKGFRPLIAS